MKSSRPAKASSAGRKGRVSSRPRGNSADRAPDFRSREEEAAFWDTHSVAEYAGALQPVDEPLEVAARARKRLLSVRLDPADMTTLREAAARYGLGAGTLARVWLLERLRGERQSPR
jgi:cytochrome c peroxidase